jgi:hypothetical protein
MRFIKIVYLTFSLFALLFSCGKKEITLLEEKEVIITQKLCYVKSANHGHGVLYNFEYDAKKQLAQLDGFPDFDSIIYENGLPKKAINSADKSYAVLYDYDTKGALSQISFTGKDSRGKAFEFKSKVYTNTKKQIERIDLLMPVFDEIIVTKIEYDTKGNMKKINIVDGTKTQTILENLTFDDKNSPYLNTPFSNVMAYFVVFSATIGSENTSYFANKNNATSSKIYSENGDVLFTYKYEYDTNGYPTKNKVSRKVQGKEETYEETYVYDCK